MPTSRIVSRIQQIESRIAEINKIGRSKPTQSTTKVDSSKPVNGDTFSEILNEVMQTKTNSQADLLSDAIDSNTLLGSRTDTLMDIYKMAGEMPISKPTPIEKYKINSSNPGTWDSHIKQTAQTIGVDEKLIHAVIQAESAYNPNAVSRAGAEGLMQLMPYTAERIGVKDSFDPHENIIGGTTVLKEMLERYDGDLIKSLAAYNAGPDAVDRANGIPRYKETQEYVPRVLNYYYNLNHRN